MEQRLVSRLIAPLALVSLVLLVSAIGSAWYTHEIQRRLAWSLTENVASVVAAQDLESSIREVDAGFDRFLITGDRSHLDSIPRLRRQTGDALIEAERWALSPEEKVLMTRVRSGHDRLFEEFDKAVAEPPGHDIRPRIAVLSDIPENEILGPARKYRHINETALARTSRETEELADRLTYGLLVLGLCGAGGGLLGGWVIATGVRRSLRRTENRLLGTAARLGAVVNTDSPDRDPVEMVDSSVSAILDRLKQTERDALRAEQLARVGQMAAGIAHEIRNPLASIKLLIQAAADPHRATPFRAKDLEVIEREIGRLELIVAGFLDFARPPHPDKSVFELKSFLEEATASLRARAEIQGVTIVTNLPADPITMCADANQIRQVVFNLVHNALDAQPRGGRVEISAILSIGNAGEESSFILKIEDEGCGFPTDLADRIFEPFVSTKQTGLGLGLSICRRIVESHGGMIRAVPRRGGGSTFTVSLTTALRTNLTPMAESLSRGA